MSLPLYKLKIVDVKQIGVNLFQVNNTKPCFVIQLENGLQDATFDISNLFVTELKRSSVFFLVMQNCVFEQGNLQPIQARFTDPNNTHTTALIYEATF